MAEGQLLDPQAKALHDAFAQTLAPNPELISQAEAFLKQASTQPGYAIAVLKLISNDGVAETTRLAAAVSFKNLVRTEWQRDEDRGRGGAGTGPSTLTEGDRDAVKGAVVELFVRCPARVSQQLCAALETISAQDFPSRWPGLMPDLLTRLKAALAAIPAVSGEAGGPSAPGSPAQLETLCGILKAFDAVLSRFRDSFLTEALSSELEAAQPAVEPLLAALSAVAEAAERAAAAEVGDGAPSPSSPLPALLRAATLLASCFYSLNSPGLTEAFEVSLGGWMAGFLRLLALPETRSSASRDPETPGALDEAKARVCDCLSLFSERNEEELAPYLAQFAQQAWKELVHVRLDPGQDPLALGALRFLTTVARGAGGAALFGDASVLATVVESVVLPNVAVRGALEEAAETNWVEYVRRDTEGSDSDTRRRGASELLRALCDAFPERVGPLCSQLVGAMLDAAAADPRGRWRDRDSALHVALTLAARGTTRAKGASATSGILDVLGFYRQHVSPVLGVVGAAPPGAADGGLIPSAAPGGAAGLATSAAAAAGSAGSYAGSVPADSLAAPVLLATSLKYLVTFRSQLPKEDLLAAFPGIVDCLAADSNVVHTYASLAAERLLAMRAAGRPALSVAELGPNLAPLLDRLFGVFDKDESEENEYAARSLVRALSFVGAGVGPVALPCLQRLSALLLRAANNPGKPGFNHSLFEAVAAVVRFGAQAARDRAAEGGAVAPSAPGAPPPAALSAALLETVAGYEAQLFPPFQAVLSQDVQEFHAYVFQILAQLLEVRAEAAGNLAGPPPPGGAAPPPAAVAAAPLPAPPAAPYPASYPTPVPLTPSYAAVFPPLLAPVFWERPGNVPGLVRLVAAYLAAGAAQEAVVGPGRLPALLGAFQKLLASKSLEAEGFSLLRAVFEHIPAADLAPYEPTVWRLLLQRLSQARTARAVRCVASFGSLRVLRAGPARLREQLEAIHPGTLSGLLGHLWLPVLPQLSSDPRDAKVAALAAAHMLRELPELEADPALAAKALDGIAALAAGAAAGTGASEEEEDDAEGAALAPGGAADAGGAAYSAAFARLHNAAPREVDPLPAVRDPGEVVARVLAAVSAQAPGRLPRWLAAVAPENQQKLALLCARAGVQLA